MDGDRPPPDLDLAALGAEIERLRVQLDALTREITLVAARHEDTTPQRARLRAVLTLAEEVAAQLRRHQQRRAPEHRGRRVAPSRD